MNSPPKLAAIVVVVVLAQVAIVDVFRVQGTAPNLVLVLAAVAGLTAGSERGAIIGFSAGFLLDLASFTPVGLGAMTAALVGYAAGAVQGATVRSSRLLPIGTAAVAGVVGTLLEAGFGAVVGREMDTNAQLLLAALIVGAGNGLLAPFIVAVMRDPAPSRTRARIAGW